jgi:hypothetical protein
VARRPVDGGVVHREGTDVNQAPPGLAFVDRLGFQMQFAFVGVVLEESTEAFQGVDVDILAGRHLCLLWV